MKLKHAYVCGWLTGALSIFAVMNYTQGAYFAATIDGVIAVILHIAFALHPDVRHGGNYVPGTEYVPGRPPSPRKHRSF